MSLQISSETTTQSYFLYSSMARSISHLSQTRPQGLWGLQKTAAWMLPSASFFSMSSKSMRHTPSSSILSGEWTISKPLPLRLFVKPM